MTATLLRIAWLNLVRDRLALVLTFVLPIAFFTIFALIFGGRESPGPGESRPLAVLVVDHDRSDTSRRLVAALEDEPGLAVATMIPDAGTEAGTPSRDDARRAVRAGDFEAAVFIPVGFGEAFGQFGEPADTVEVLYNPANPIAEFAVSGLLQAAAFSAAPDVLLEQGVAQLEELGGGLTPAQRDAVASMKEFLREGSPDNAGGSTRSGGGLIQVETLNVREMAAPGEEPAPASYSMISYYAAGMGVMFLLFSMSAAAGSILQEEESGALERLLMSRCTTGAILTAKWIFYAMLGVAQVTVMFIYGSLVFDLPLWTANHLAGFAVVVVVTALAASAFGLLLATVCRTRAQLSGLSTIVILIMSAVGGSMVPRFIMPAFMETASRFTFNGWAMDAFLAVFWNDEPGLGILESLQPVVAPVLVMAGMIVAFLAIARSASRRWEAD